MLFFMVFTVFGLNNDIDVKKSWIYIAKNFINEKHLLQLQHKYYQKIL